MENSHPHSGATYRTIRQADGSFGIEVRIPGTHPTLVTSFASEDAAALWIAKHQAQIAEGNALRRTTFGKRQ
jgi:hypothetical protein